MDRQRSPAPGRRTPERDETRSPRPAPAAHLLRLRRCTQRPSWAHKTSMQRGIMLLVQPHFQFSRRTAGASGTNSSRKRLSSRETLLRTRGSTSGAAAPALPVWFHCASSSSNCRCAAATATALRAGYDLGLSLRALQRPLRLHGQKLPVALALAIARLPPHPAPFCAAGCIAGLRGFRHPLRLPSAPRPPPPRAGLRCAASRVPPQPAAVRCMPSVPGQPERSSPVVSSRCTALLMNRSAPCFSVSNYRPHSVEPFVQQSYAPGESSSAHR